MGLALDQSPVSGFCHSVIFGYLHFFFYFLFFLMNQASFFWATELGFGILPQGLAKNGPLDFCFLPLMKSLSGCFKMFP